MLARSQPTRGEQIVFRPQPAGEEDGGVEFLEPASSVETQCLLVVLSNLQDDVGTAAEARGMFDLLVSPSGEIVGTIGLYPVSTSTCELRKMYLAKSVRGQGHGRRLLDHALTRARKLGFTRVTLETAEVLQNAVALYERYGFKPYTPDHKSCRCDRAYYLDLA